MAAYTADIAWTLKSGEDFLNGRYQSRPYLELRRRDNHPLRQPRRTLLASGP